MTAGSAHRDRRGRWHRRCYAALLRAYPAAFRLAYGRQMEEDFADLLEVSGRGPGRVRAWAIALADLTRSALRERARRAVDTRASLATREPMTMLISDVRVALRGFRRAPAFPALVIATLAVGIGGTVAMFSVMDAVLFAGLPHPDGDRMVMIWNRHTTSGAERVQVSGPDFLDYRRGASSFSDFAFIHNATDSALTDGNRAEQVHVGYVSANLFAFLGVPAFAGRTFAVDEAAASGTSMAQVGPVVISHGLWSRRYGSDPAAIGRTIALAGTPVQIVGVLPPDFRFVLPYAEGGTMSSGANERIDVWRVLPERSFASMPRSVAVVRVLAKLAPGVSLASARDELNGVAGRLRAEHRVHADRGTAIDVVSLQADVVRHVRPIMLSLFGGVSVLLLIACANVANLVSINANSRTREVAVRMALGGGRGRIVRQMLTEHVVLAAVGGLVGLGLAWLAIDAVVALAPAHVPSLESATLSLRALAFAITVTGATVLLFGLWPAWRAAQVVPTRLAANDRTVVGRGNRFRAAMVVVEVALSVVLLSGGGLLIRSFMQLQQATLGFEPAAALTARITFGRGPYDDAARRRQYWETLRRELGAHPAVRLVGLTWPLPFTGQGAEVPFDRQPFDAATGGRFVAFTASTLPGYFETVGATVRAGRLFEDRDLERADAVAVVDRGIAEQLYPDGAAVGQSLWFADRSVEIIGVVEHLRHSRLSGPERDVIHLLTPEARTLAVVVRARGDASALVADLRRITGAVDRDVPADDVRTLASYVDAMVAPTRFTMTLAAAFALCALILAVVGLYGVVAYAVSERRAEFGLRLALGAPGSSVVRLVMGLGAVTAGIGVAIGVVGALGVARAIGNLLTDVPPYDPLTFVATALVLGVAALAASYVPARRAARLDPMKTLRRG